MSTLRQIQMGIKGLCEFLRKNAPSAFFRMPITNLSGKRIAIDSHGYFHTIMAVARKNVVESTNILSGERPCPVEIRKCCLRMVLDFIVVWMSYGITPIFVFDGPDKPGKEEVREKRQESRNVIKKRIDQMYEEIEKSPLSANALFLDLRRQLSNYGELSKEDFETYEAMIANVGVPYIRAKGDGERLCSAMCVEGQVAAVFSKDTDNIAHGCPLLCTSFAKAYEYTDEGRVHLLECIRIDEILKALSLEKASFVDLCIMSGCDYNNNIPKISVGRSFPLIKKHSSIDKLPTSMDVSCLNHVSCRELFGFTNSDSLILDGNKRLCFNQDAIGTCRDFMEAMSLADKILLLVQNKDNISKPEDGFPASLNLGNPFALSL